MSDDDIECPDCLGTGQAIPDCEICDGDGWEADPSDGGTMVCTGCFDEQCYTCYGAKYITPTEDPK